MKVSELRTEEGRAKSLAIAREELDLMLAKGQKSMNTGALNASNPDSLARVLKSNSSVNCDTSILVRNIEKYA